MESSSTSSLQPGATSSMPPPSARDDDDYDMLGRLISDRRCWQYWFIHLGPIVTVFIAFLLGTISTDSCSFMLIEKTSASKNVDADQALNMLNDSSNLLRAGLFRIGSANTNQECFTWQHYGSVADYFNDPNGTPGPIVTAQVFAVLACLIGVAVVILLFLGFYFQRFLTYRVFRIVFPTMLIFAGFFQLLTFLVFAMDGCKASSSDDNNAFMITTCSMLVAGRQSLCAALLYTGMGIGLIWYPKLSRPLLQGKNYARSNDNKMYTSSEEAEDLIEDGGAVEVVNMDGGQNRINVVENNSNVVPVAVDGFGDVTATLEQNESGLDIYEKDSRSTS
mmetsp:Transcript_10370/g.15253  ORF Transcript_10370/g.15253 Transcript_10370/m.15253 type:complete len:335 (+) Transcript_10370:167-1171(+)